ncbi:MAG: Bug family tripartite tricarboxylate transporter substrate binding protein [Lautropia sp.]
MTVAHPALPADRLTGTPRAHRRTTTAALGLAAAAIALGAVIPTPTAAADLQPLRILVGFPPGGSADLLARIIAESARSDFSNIIVENRPGASGRLAIGLVKNAKPDGQTVLILPFAPLAIFPHVYKKLEFDPFKDFTPVSLLARFQFGVTSGPGSNATSIADMLAKVKADPRSTTFGTPGEGSAPHFLVGLMSQAAGVPFTHVPFQGGAPANTALLGGHVGYKVDVVLESAEFHRSGKARIIGVAGSKRDPVVPEVPTLKEQGLDVEVSGWFAMIAPAGVAPDVLKRLETSIGRAVRQKDVAEKLGRMGYEPVGSTSAELAAQQKADYDKWARPIAASGFKLD